MALTKNRQSQYLQNSIKCLSSEFRFIRSIFNAKSLKETVFCQITYAVPFLDICSSPLHSLHCENKPRQQMALGKKFTPGKLFFDGSLMQYHFWIFVVLRYARFARSAAKIMWPGNFFISCNGLRKLREADARPTKLLNKYYIENAP